MGEFSWLHWVGQTVTGAFVGGIAAALIALGSPRFSGSLSFGMWVETPSAMVFTAGGALLLGGIAGLWGDRLWHRQMHLGVGPNTRASGITSLAGIVIGTLAIGYGLVRFLS